MTARSRLSLPRALGLALPLLAGCGPAVPTEAAPEPGVTRGAEVRIANALTTQALVLNAIATNPTANGLVGTRALRAAFHPDTGNAYLRQQLVDADAVTFMEYLVGCALPKGQHVAWRGPWSNEVSTWAGDAGLCPEWADAAPSQACLHRVSSCILARNNAYGLRVELSLRGEDVNAPEKFSLEALTRPSEYEPYSSTRVESLKACTLPASSAQRDCGWTPDALGRCTPGEEVWVGAGGVPSEACGSEPLGTTLSGRAVLRVCEGLSSCNADSGRNLGQSEGSCGDTAPAVSFVCPASGTFNAMTAPYLSTQTATVRVEARAGLLDGSDISSFGAKGPTGGTTRASVAYRLSEAQAFSSREGAFYGTLFDPNALAAAPVEVLPGAEVATNKEQVVTGPVFLRMHSCYDPAWLNGAAYASHRVCAQPNAGANCAASVVGPCIDLENPSLSVCEQNDAEGVRSGDYDYGRCHDGEGALWTEPVTSFLNAPCNMDPAGTWCQRGTELTSSAVYVICIGVPGGGC